ncbi:MAG: hypothetical protein ACYTG5_20110 [Planctomycetota bacterium]|jgi:hypothetical protein
MRTFFGFFFVLLLSTSLPAQERKVRVEMKSGKVFEALLKDVTEDRVLLQLPEGELKVETGKIAKIEELRPSKPAKTNAETSLPQGGDPEVGQPGWSMREIELGGEKPSTAVESVQESKAEMATPAGPGVETQPIPAARPEAELRGADARVAKIVDRFLWIVPQTSGNRISLGASIFILLVFLIQLCTRMANLEGRNLSRSGTLAAFLFLVLAIQLSVTPAELPFILGVAVLDVLLWYLMVHLLYRAGIYGATVMLVSFVLASLLGVLSLEVVGFVLQESTIH